MISVAGLSKRHPHMSTCWHSPAKTGQLWRHWSAGRGDVVTVKRDTDTINRRKPQDWHWHKARLFLTVTSKSQASSCVIHLHKVRGCQWSFTLAHQERTPLYNRFSTIQLRYSSRLQFWSVEHLMYTKISPWRTAQSSVCCTVGWVSDCKNVRDNLVRHAWCLEIGQYNVS